MVTKMKTPQTDIGKVLLKNKNLLNEACNLLAQLQNDKCVIEDALEKFNVPTKTVDGKELPYLSRVLLCVMRYEPQTVFDDGADEIGW